MSVLAVLAWVGAVVTLVAGLSAWALGARLARGEGSLLAGLGGLAVVLALGYTVVGWGLWTRRRWAWYATFIVEIAAVVLGVLALLEGALVSALVSFLIAAIVVGYLLRREVQAWFGVAFTRNAGRGRTVG